MALNQIMQNRAANVELGNGKFKKKVKSAIREEKRKWNADYSHPVRRAIKNAVGNVSEGTGNVLKKIKEAPAKRRTMADARGKTSRNSSVGLCTKGGKCQQ